MTPHDRVRALDLDAFRRCGDPLLDERIAAIPAPAIGEMLGRLFRQSPIPRGDERFASLLDALPAIPICDRESVAAGQELFALYGPEVLLILGSYSLPAAYAAADGVQVIHRSRRLQDDALRRVLETAQMVINVMRPGELEPGGLGHRTALKVRLMHGLIRRHVRDLDRPGPWLPTLGEPINQEDLAGTLLSFSLAVLRGLRKIGCRLRERDEIGFLAVWRHIGLLLGIDPRLAPETMEEAEALALRIGQRQFRSSPEGQSLARELVSVVDGLFPVPGYGNSLMHFFLEDSVFGVDLAEILGLPRPNWTRALVHARAVQKRLVLAWLPHVPGAVARRRVFARFFAQRLISLRSPDKDGPFEVPDAFVTGWRLRRVG